MSPSLSPVTASERSTLEVGNILDLPEDRNNKFALVHQRLLVSALKYDEWDQAIKNIFRITAPQGWIQLTEAYIDTDIFSSGPASLKGIDNYDTLWKTVKPDVSALGDSRKR